MARDALQVIFTESAWADLEEVAAYWSDRDEPERGQKYARDLPAEAIRQLSTRSVAKAGRFLSRSAYPEVQELPLFKHSCRVLYLLKEAEGVVEVLRFWHSHRDEPFRD